jgi:hypothetical protein
MLTYKILFVNKNYSNKWKQFNVSHKYKIFKRNKEAKEQKGAKGENIKKRRISSERV